MRITYTRDHFQRSYIIQIVLDDDQMEGLPLSVNLKPQMFIKLSEQLRLLATVAEFLEAAQTEEDSSMAITPDEQELDETEEENNEEEEVEEEEIPDEEEAEIEEEVAEEVFEEEEEIPDEDFEEIEEEEENVEED